MASPRPNARPTGRRRITCENDWNSFPSCSGVRPMPVSSTWNRHEDLPFVLLDLPDSDDDGAAR
jgi:hypothetical protein